MSKPLKQEDNDIAELWMRWVSSNDLEIENDIKDWLQTPPVQPKGYGFVEVDGEGEYGALLNELSDLLMER